MSSLLPSTLGSLRACSTSRRAPGPGHAIRAAVTLPVWARSTTPLVIGHRGASSREPENSVAAFRRAAVDGADGVELDVLCCGTGEVVVFHDDDLLRLGGRPDRV